MSGVRVLVVDDSDVFRRGVVAVLASAAPALTVVAEAGNGALALKLAETHRPDVALVDLKMAPMDGVELTSALRQRFPACQVVVLTTFDDHALIFRALRAGACGYLLKDATAEALVHAIEAAHRGESALSPRVASKVVAELMRLPPGQSPVPPELSPREMQIVRLMARGLANKEIASALNLAEGTVKNYVTSILEKLEVQDRTQAALKARDLGLL